MAQDRYRLAVLGSSQTGKTCIIKRYLNNTYNERYRETIEDIYSRDFYIQSVLLSLDIYDTNFTYPDMRKLMIASANAFVLVFAVNDVKSFKNASDIMHEIMKFRSGEFNDLPIVVVGNKSDLLEKKLLPATVNAWLTSISAQENVRYLEVSAKEDYHIRDIFQTLLEISGFPYHIKSSLLTPGSADQPNSLTPGSYRRQVSVRTRSPMRRRIDSDGLDDEGKESQSPESSRAMVQRKVVSGVNRLTRHDSLIRRTSRLSLRIRPVQAETDNSDCKIS